MTQGPGREPVEAADPARGNDPARPGFAHASEAEFARILDFYQVEWRYEPHAFPILWSLEGDVLESFAPDFYLPELDMYVEMTTLRQKLVRKKNRKLRRLRELYPDVRIKLFYARDFRALMLKYGRVALADAFSGAEGQFSAANPRPLAAGDALAEALADAPLRRPTEPARRDRSLATPDVGADPRDARLAPPAARVAPPAGPIATREAVPARRGGRLTAPEGDRPGPPPSTVGSRGRGGSTRLRRAGPSQAAGAPGGRTSCGPGAGRAIIGPETRAGSAESTGDEGAAG